MPAGRPTDYTPELLEKAYKYLDGGWKKVGHKIPSVVGLAVYLGTSRNVLYVWAKDEKKEEFNYILASLQTIQELTLVNNGLDGTFNPSIAKLVLGKHGYHDKQDIDNSGVITHDHQGIPETLGLLRGWRGDKQEIPDKAPLPN